MNEIENPESDPHTYKNLILMGLALHINVEKSKYSKNGLRKIYIYRRKLKMNPYLIQNLIPHKLSKLNST